MNHSFHLRIATALSHLLDEQFSFLGMRFGLDPILGLFPGIGDAISLFLSCYMIVIGMMMRLPEDKMTQMVKNVILDFLIGLLPVVGDVADFVYKANKKNLQILREHAGATVIEGDIV